MTASMARLYHDPALDVTLTRLDELEIRVALPPDAEDAELVLWDKYKKEEQGVRRLSLSRWAQTPELAYYRSVLRSDGPRVRYLQYIFTFKKGGQNKGGQNEVLQATGLAGEGEGERTVPFQFSYAGDRDALHRPSWINNRVWYQIFPDRFFRGEPSRDSDGIVPWQSEPDRHNFFGGDLAGIIAKLDYLERLGVNAVYLNPVFVSRSNHKYDTEDYFAVDPAFGTREDLKRLADACHERDIKLVLDLVVNHCSYYHPFFQDVVERGEASPYKDWFYLNRLPIAFGEEDYDSVGYYKWMPKLRTSNPEVQRYIYNIVSFWQEETGIDGWRIDVADEVEFRFLGELNSKVKQLNQAAYIIAEIWYDAKPMLAGRYADSVMNYELRDILLAFVADERIGSEQFHEQLVRHAHRYSLAEAAGLYNLLGSHDTERVWTRCGEDKSKLLMLLALQFMLPGMPAVYYGDEAGMAGENDPGCRAGMRWEAGLEEGDIWRETAEWARLRKGHEALLDGDVSLDHLSDVSAYMVARKGKGKELRLVFNASSRVSERSAAEIVQAGGIDPQTAKIVRCAGADRLSEAMLPWAWVLLEINDTGGFAHE
ncbi:glycoside hydrolase family 13 protein [Cohnella fermenti]|uniref:Alpha-glycosidase n=1 Tax=Cohnella fermenti TaxID=2565925 RepID=A0A4S4C382_9BACL|nr:glycoside hydrolase family 13 protein [Cohnella fermenti]THF82185.1 alpha-glycosidase [Cohnella fermenti]